MIEKVSREEWISRNPSLQKFIRRNPTGWMRTPEFNLWPEVESIEGIDDHQRSQLALATSGRIGILGGSPGTGKTFTVAKLISTLLKSGEITANDIGVGAPTGKAAVRLSEMMQSSGLPLRARTWHSLLGVQTSKEAGGMAFVHNENNTFDYRLLVGDESSMLDLSLMCSVFRARPKGCHFLLVGDVNQLPPVGRGAPLRDMIASGLPYGELKEIKRNSGGIVEACAAIRDEQPWLHFARGDESNLRITNDCQEYKIERIMELIRKSEENGFDPVWDCQVLVAVNESSPLSREAVNERLQDELNPGPKHARTKFRPGDKVVCLKNGFYKSIQSEDEAANEKGEVFVANGELAEVKSVDSNDVTFQLESPSRMIAVSLGAKKSDDGDEEKQVGAISNWDLGYALSVHKSQGSEWPVVIVALDSYAGARMICDRSWIYTAISRARQKCYLVGESELAERFCRVQKINQRKTFLKDLIQSQLFMQTLGSI